MTKGCSRLDTTGLRTVDPVSMCPQGHKQIQTRSQPEQNILLRFENQYGKVDTENFYLCVNHILSRTMSFEIPSLVEKYTYKKTLIPHIHSPLGGSSESMTPVRERFLLCLIETEGIMRLQVTLLINEYYMSIILSFLFKGIDKY